MDVLQLRYLLAIAETGSISRAAASLRVAQPSLTQRMNRLERELGVRLLDRHPTGARLTPAGSSFVRDAHRLVRQFDHLVTSAKEEQEVRGLVSVGLPSGAATHLAAPLCAWVRRHWPGVRLELFESMSGYIQELFRTGRMDLALAYGVGPAPARGSEPVLYAESLYLLGEPPGGLPEPDRATVADLAGVPIVAPGMHSQLRGLIEGVVREHDVEPVVIAHVESLGTMVRLAEDGEACALLPWSAATGSGAVARRLEPEIVRHAVIRTASPTSAPEDAVSVVREGITTVTRELAASGRWPGIRIQEDLRA